MNGKGYIHNVFPKAAISWSTEIFIIEFKTKESDVVLFYSGDMNELVPVGEFRSTLIYIDNAGHLAYNFTRSNDKINRTINIKLTNKHGGIFNDNQWHKLKFIRTLNKAISGYELKISIEEDDISIYKNTFSTLTLFIKTRFLSIGGVSNKYFGKRNFMGCLFKVIYKADNIQLDVLLLTQYKNHGFSEIGESIVFSKTCQENLEDYNGISFLTTKSFVILKTKYDVYKSYDLTIEFLPKSPSFLLYFHRSVNNEHFISVEVREMQIVIGISYLSKITMWYPSECKIDFNSKHTFHLLIDYINTVAKLDFNDISLENQIYPKSYDISLNYSVFFSSEIILGGDKFSKTSVKYFPSNVWMATLRKGFKGCIEKVILNDETFDLLRSLKSVKSEGENYMMKGCFQSTRRQTDCKKILSRVPPCKNNAYCENNWPNITCNCDYTNYHGNNCNKANQAIHFDGSGFIRLDLGTEFYTEVESIFVRFKTSYTDAYVFSMNPSDSSEWTAPSIQLTIENGLPTFEFLPINEKQIFKLYKNVSDGKWHSLTILRNYRTLSLNLDGKVLQQEIFNHQDKEKLLFKWKMINFGIFAIYSNETILSWQQIKMAAPLKSTDLHYSRPFSPKMWMIINNSDKQNSKQNLKPNFVGQIIKFKINDIDIVNEYLLQKITPNNQWKLQAQAKLNNNNDYNNNNYNDNNNNKNNNINNDKKIIYPITFHTHGAYLKLIKPSLYDSFSLLFYLKTNQRSGLLLMVGNTTKDFILLELNQGDIKLSFNMGSNVQAINTNCGSSCDIADRNWHSIEISRQDLNRNVLSLSIDNVVIEEITILNSHKARNFNFEGPGYLGGLPKNEYENMRENIISNFGFQGCIAGFSINRRNPINLLQNSSVEIPQEFKSQIDHNCQSNMTVCKESHCKNGGQCLQHFQTASCDCSYTTFDGEYCTIVSGTIIIRRQVASFNYVQLKYQDRSRNTSRDDIAFGLQTKKSEGTIIFIESKRKEKGDFMHLYLENGKMILEYDMGAGIMKLTDHSIKVSDGFYRRVRIRRLGASAWLQIDNSRSELEPKSLNIGRSFNEQTFIWVGAVPNKKEGKQFEGLLSGLIFNGINVNRVLEKKKKYPYLKVLSVGDIHINLTMNIKLPKNSEYEITEIGTKKTKMYLESSTSLKSLCNDLKRGQCSTTKSNIKKHSKSKLTTPVQYYQSSDILIISTTYDGYNSSTTTIISKRSLIIIFTCFSIVLVVISFCVICRCFRKRGDRGSYNLTKADTYEQKSSIFDPRPDLQSSTSIQSITPEKDMIELSPLSKNLKILDTSPNRLNNGIILSSGGSTQTIATYIPKTKEQNRKKKEIKEWYV